MLNSIASWGKAVKIHQLVQQQTLPISIEQAWEFFSDPKNLNEITPDDLGFRITHCPEGKMYEGEIITYRVKVAPMIWVRWVTEIKAVEEGVSFIDEQRAGPYRFWHHRHHFREVPEGVEMTDTVNYSVGMGIFGEIAGVLFVHAKLQHVFRSRRELLAKRFGECA